MLALGGWSKDRVIVDAPSAVVPFRLEYILIPATKTTTARSANKW